jgi:drug/metabolite transporter (DMT)-like permease
MLPYLLLASVSSVLLAIGLLMMKARADDLPAAYGANIFSAIFEWLRDPMWMGGLVVQAAGYALYVLSLSNAQVSMVAVMQQGGIAFFVVLSIMILGERARPIEWAGIAAIMIGMVMLGLSLSPDDSQGAMDSGALLRFSILTTFAGLVPYMIERYRANGVAPAILSGVLFGLAGLFAKGMTNDLVARSSAPILLRLMSDPCFYGVIVGNIVGIVLLQNSFTSARGIIAMPLSSALSNIVPIAGGMLAFGEHLPFDHTAASMRITAFVLTVGGSALLADSRAPSVEPVAEQFESQT